MYSRIRGTGSYLPEQTLTNADIEKLVDTTDEWIKKRVGVEKRQIIGESNDTTSSMATEAARRAIEAAGLQPEDIGMIVVGTATSDYFFPSTACLVQKGLGITTECAAFDLNAACSGFIYALSVADQYIKSGATKYALVIGVDSLTKMIDWTDRSTCVLFGDGAGAVVLEPSEEKGIIKTTLRADGHYDEALFAKSPVWDRDASLLINMKGNEVFKVAVTKLGEIVDQVLAEAGMEKTDIDWLIPHQANLRIIAATARKLGLPMERVVLTVAEHGNTSAASIPLALDHAVKAGTVKRGQTLLLEAFGAGLAWGAALLVY
jgi:3-oxoacyl-[acyl-carrier-protein] synthase III